MNKNQKLNKYVLLILSLSMILGSLLGLLIHWILKVSQNSGTLFLFVYNRYKKGGFNEDSSYSR